MPGIYIHIPFCVKKCNYCDFVSGTDTGAVSGYIDALCREIELTGNMYGNPVDTIFIGGGTPGVLDVGIITKVMDTLRNNYVILNDAEVTIETNPCVITAEKLEEYLKCGINRISIGLQSAQNRLLQLLGRQHSVEDFDAAFALARAAGFSNINIDVMYAIPTQTPGEWEETLYHALYLRPAHISAYALKLEEGTPLAALVAQGGLAEADEDTDADMYLQARRILGEKGYTNYEISNFSFAGRECRHNLKYWSLENYLGLGVAAHSNIERLRFANTDDIAAYMANMKAGRLRYASSEFITDKNRMFEYVMLKLRLKDGFTFREFRTLFGIDFEKTRGAEMKEAEQQGLIARMEEGIAPTEKGFFLQNQLIHILTGR